MKVANGIAAVDMNRDLDPNPNPTPNLKLNRDPDLNHNHTPNLKLNRDVNPDPATDMYVGYVPRKSHSIGRCGVNSQSFYFCIHISTGCSKN